MVDYIDDHVDRYGVEPICAQLPIAPSTHYAHKAREADVTKLSARACLDAELENFRACGAYKIWQPLTVKVGGWCAAPWSV